MPTSLSEYGCITNGRDFGEVEALMNPEMTGVYSGGLMYEYSEEGSGYGIVSIEGGTVSEEAGFTKFASALSEWPAPTGDGGFTSTTNAVACPTQDADWLVDSTLLPAIPDGALAYMKSGAGTGPGFASPGSQDAKGTSTGNASPGSGASTDAAASTTTSGDSAAARLMSPVDTSLFVVSGLVFFLTLAGTLLL